MCIRDRLYALDEQVRRHESEGKVTKYEGWEFLSAVLDDNGVCRGICAMDLDVYKRQCLDDCSPEESNQDGHLDKWSRDPVPVGTKSPSSGIFSVGFQGPDLIGDEKMQSWRQTGLSKEIGIAVGGDYQKPDDPTHTCLLYTSRCV